MAGDLQHQIARWRVNSAAISAKICSKATRCPGGRALSNVVDGQIQVHLETRQSHLGDQHPEERPALVEQPQATPACPGHCRVPSCRAAPTPNQTRQQKAGLWSSEHPGDRRQDWRRSLAPPCAAPATGNLQLADLLDFGDLARKKSDQIRIVVDGLRVVQTGAGAQPGHSARSSWGVVEAGAHQGCSGAQRWSCSSVVELPALARNTSTPAPRPAR